MTQQPATLSIRDKVSMIEEVMLRQPQLSLLVKHHFAPGVYARELEIPKGTLLTGKIHKHEHLSIMTKGRLRVLIDDQMVEVAAPFIYLSPPGTKRIAYAMEDTVWVTIHATSKTDVAEIERDTVAETEDEYQEYLAAAERETLPCPS